jgi:hypothetical protein
MAPVDASSMDQRARNIRLAILLLLLAATFYGGFFVIMGLR